MDGFLMDDPMKMDDDWGYHHFRKPPYGCIYGSNPFLLRTEVMEDIRKMRTKLAKLCHYAQHLMVPSLTIFLLVRSP